MTYESFYKSDEWRNLLQQLKLERVNEEGLLICPICGKPLTGKIIGHHKKELTKENYLDYDISLNPENIILIHQDCHNMIHKRWGYQKKEVYLIYGSPCSGKNTYVNNIVSRNDIVVDIDNIWYMINPQNNRYEKPDTLKSIVFSIRNNLYDLVKYRQGKWSNCYVIAGVPNSLERQRLIQQLGVDEVHLCEVTEEECLCRLHACSDGRDIKAWESYIHKWFEEYSE